MNFDAAVSYLEQALLPSLWQHEQLAQACGNYKEIEVVSVRHADVFHAIGIRCHPKWAMGSSETLSFGVSITKIRKLIARSEIQWSADFDSRDPDSGYQKFESRPISRLIVTEGDLDIFVNRWKRMAQQFSTIVQRGRPSSRIVRWMRGAPADRFGLKSAAY